MPRRTPKPESEQSIPEMVDELTRQEIATWYKDGMRKRDWTSSSTKIYNVICVPSSTKRSKRGVRMNQKLLPMDNACGVNARCLPSLQDFTASSSINQQLYAKYGLTESEQKFIESMIKPME